jgi:hypothetical protein
MSDDPTTPATESAPPASPEPRASEPQASAPTAVPFAASPERQRFMRRLTPTLLVVGAVLLVVFESTITLLLGVTLLLSAVVSGVFMIAEPGFLAADDE